jgi:hypothetical protein
MLFIERKRVVTTALTLSASPSADAPSGPILLLERFFCFGFAEGVQSEQSAQSAQSEQSKENSQKNSFSDVPRHGEADLLFLFHIRRLFQRSALAEGGSFLVRGTNDRDLLAVLAFPFEPNLAERVWWCKGTNSYGMSSHGEWVKPSLLTGEPVSCHEYVSMRRVFELMGGQVDRSLPGQVDRSLCIGAEDISLPLIPVTSVLLTRLMLMFFFGGDYCECPKGLTASALSSSLFEQQNAIVVQLDARTLGLNVAELHYFIQNTSVKSNRCKSRLEAGNLLKCTLDAFYSLCYYTGFHNIHCGGIGIAVGPDVADFGYTGVDSSYVEKKELVQLFEPLLRPVLVGGVENVFLVFSF